MNCSQAKRASIVEYLFSTGHQPIKKAGNSYWFNLREENTASLKVDIVSNVWYDYGIGKGGKLPELIMTYFSKTLSEALMIIGDTTHINSVSAIKTTNTHAETTTTIEKVIEVTSPVLMEYLESRRIRAGWAGILRELHYNVSGRSYFGLCWKNDAGGYEVRNKYFKGCIGSKSITTIEGSGQNNDLNIFEGMMDYLSAIQLHEPKNKTIVLNSLINLKQVENTDKYNTVNVYFDNDSAGKEAFKMFNILNTNSLDCSKFYYPYKDFNDFLINKKP